MSKKNQEVANTMQQISNGEISAKDLLKNFSKVFGGSAGIKGEKDLYKSFIYEGALTEAEKKKCRTPFRTQLNNAAAAIIRAEETKNIQRLKEVLIPEFLDFYSKFYRVNDFSLISICGSSTSNQRKEILQQMLDIVKKYQN